MFFGRIIAKFKIYLIMALAFAAFAGVAYWYYTDTQKALRTYAENQGKMEIALTSQKAVTESLQRDIRVMNETLNSLNTEFEESRARVSELENLLETGTDGREMKIDERAVEDPVYIEKEINTGTIELFNCFEILSGAEGNENDQKYINCLNGNSGTDIVQ